MKLSKENLAVYSLILRSMRLDDLLEWKDGVREQDLKHYWMKTRKREDFIFPSYSDFLEMKSDLEEDEKIVSIFDPEYPAKFMELDRPPLAFLAKGNTELLKEHSVSVVGSRKLRANVADWAELHLEAYLKTYKPVVVSGAARGVDRLAHTLALRTNCKTIAFLPCGFREIYPANFKPVAKDILNDGGLLISEYLPHLKMRVHYFHERNRLIAAASKLLLVLQAERKSGSLITANVARGMNREIASLPGDPTDPVFWGTNDLIAEGAHLLRDRDDLVCLHQSTKQKPNRQFEDESEEWKMLNQRI